MKSLSRRAIFVAAGVSCAIVVLGAGVALLLYRSAALESGEWHLRNTALALAEHARQGLMTADIALRATAEEYSREIAAGSFAEEVFHRRMRQRATELPQVRSLLLIAPDGRLAAHSEAFPAPALDFGDRDYFAAHRDAPDDAAYFGAPAKGRLIQTWTHPISRRIGGDRGQFLGIVSAGMEIPYFHDVYRALELGPGGHVFIFRRDGLLLNSFPQNEARLGTSFKSHPLFSAPSTGVLYATGLVDGESRLIAHHALPGYPLVVAVSSTERYILREWLQQSIYAAVGTLAAISFILAGALLLLRQVRVSEDLAGVVAASEQRLNAVIESAMDAIITIDRNHRIVLFNAAAEHIFGCPAHGAPELQALGAPLDRFIPERFRTKHRGHIERFAQTGVSMRRMGEKISLFGLRADGEEFPIDASISQVEVAGEKYYTVILRDVTVQQQAERQLRDSEARLNAIIGSAMDAIITVDEQQNILLFNTAAERIFGCSSETAVGGALDRFIPARYREAHRDHIERFGRTGVTMRRMGENIVLAGVRADGEEFPIDASISQVTVGGRRFYTVILRDITERQKSAEQLDESHRELRELYGVMHEVREAERIRIARELHDELAQWLTALKMDVSWIAARLPKELTRLMDKTARMKEVVDTTVAAVRRIASDLRPVMIDDLGLVPAIEHQLHEFSQRTGILVSLDTPTDGIDFRDPVATAVYRMVQEALTNVARHAEATRVQVSLTARGDVLVATVQDNGRGIDEERVRKSKSYGVLGIRERAQTLGGSARIFRPDEGGTIVEITIPMRAQKREERAA